MPDYSVEQELVQFGEGSLTFLEPRFWIALTYRRAPKLSRLGGSRHFPCRFGFSPAAIFWC